MTKNGIEMNLHLTPWVYSQVYPNGQTVVYCFSSELYRNKFIERQEHNRDQINGSLSNRFNIIFENIILCDLVLYKRIEKRGFLIQLNGEELCQNEVKLNGDKLTKVTLQI